MTRRPDPSLLDLHDGLLLDLDGTVMHGTVPIEHAAQGVQAAREAGLTIVFATNNASRTPQQAAEHLATVGVEAAAEELVTSPQVASQLLSDELPTGSHVLVVGGPSLAAEIQAVGLQPVCEDGPAVAAVVQGWAPDLAWPLLAEGAYAIRRGALWMATNVDATLPTEKGLAPGNGSMVASLRHATGVEPRVAGKPEPGMFQVAARSRGLRRPLVIGDRLDTDIEGANRAEIDSLLVLTGVSSIEDALHADPLQRPTHVATDMSILSRPFPLPVVHGPSARVGRVAVRWDGEDLVATGTIDDPAVARAALALLKAQRPEQAWTGQLRSEDEEDTEAASR